MDKTKAQHALARLKIGQPLKFVIKWSEVDDFFSLIDGIIEHVPASEFDTEYTEELLKKYKKLKAKQLKRTPLIEKAKKVAHAAKSITQTTLQPNKYAVDDSEFNRRLDICRTCKFAVFKKGKLHTCGPMLEEQKAKTGKTCGCVLNKKARDNREQCPNDYWNNPTQLTIDGNKIA